MVLREPTQAIRIFIEILAVLLFAAGCVPIRPPPAVEGPLHLSRLEFADLIGWRQGDARPGLNAFLRSCEVIRGLGANTQLGGAGYAGTAGDWREVCAIAESPEAAAGVDAHAFFEDGFHPYRVSLGSVMEGLFTGYYEPELRGSLTMHGPYRTPLHGVPTDLISVDLGLFREQFEGQRILGRIVEDRLVPYLPRAEIARGGAPSAETLLYVDDPVDAFFLQVQGSGRVVLDDGTVLRASYAGQNGHPYTAIGAVLMEWGELERDEVSMQSIRGWLAAHPDRLQELLDRNASYVFFSVQPLGDPNLGARGAQGVPLIPRASLAVDRTVHPLGIPMWLETTMPGPESATPGLRFDQLMVAQDTGGAIRGAIRGDIYWGFGETAGSIAGRMRSPGRLVVILPRALATRLGPEIALPEFVR